MCQMLFLNIKIQYYLYVESINSVKHVLMALSIFALFSLNFNPDYKTLVELEPEIEKSRIDMMNKFNQKKDLKKRRANKP